MSNKLFGNKNFILHWGSVIIAQTGNFFTAIALPWLVLSTTDDNPVAMAGVIAATSLSQSLFILFGGVLTDIISPIKTLFWSRFLYILVMVSMATFIYFGFIPLWLIYIYALILGALGAFSIPANESLLPMILDQDQLHKGNSAIMGTMQLTHILGPMLAGWALWFMRTIRNIPEGQTDFGGFAFVFYTDAAAIMIATALLFFIKAEQIPRVHKNVIAMVRKGLRFCWHDRGIRLVLIYMAFTSFCLHGPVWASLPVMIKVKFAASEGAYGTLYGMIGVGTIIGIAICAWMAPASKNFGQVLLCCDLLHGLTLFTLGYVNNIYLAGLILLIAGIFPGFVLTTGMTWFQKRTPKIYMGRVIGILMFVIFGLIPLSALLVGYLINLTSVSIVISLSGALAMFLAAVGLAFPQTRNMGKPRKHYFKQATARAYS